MGTADKAWGNGYGAREFAPRDWANARWRRRASSWTAFEIIAVVLGFIVFWPIGLMVIGYKYWQSRSGGPDLQTFVTEKWQDARDMASKSSGGAFWRGAGFASTTGNMAFDEWRAAELARLEEERRKLDEAQRDFAEYVEAIRRAKDREEFERFMAERRSKPADGGAQPG